jgi:S1-C subfamily serine protease
MLGRTPSGDRCALPIRPVVTNSKGDTMARFLLVLMLVATSAERAFGQQTSPKGTLEVVVALVGDELQIRPVPLMELELSSLVDSANHATFRTELDGRATHVASAGAYQLRSLRPATFAGKSYTWALQVRIEPGKTTRLELTNLNADSSVSPVAGRQLAPEILLYERIRRAVLRVNSGNAHGSGFLLDTLGGVVVTNEHVVAGGQALSVTIDSVTRVPARLVVIDHDADLAIIRFDMTACGGCPHLRLAIPDSLGRTVVPGERVVAVGFPLSQQSSVTAGIVSGVRERAIISDVNINHGNSGGPLLNMAGEVAGINAFAESDQNGGPGVSGSITATSLLPLLARARDTIVNIPTPEPRRLPMLTGAAYPIRVIRSVADTANVKDYKVLYLRRGDFTISVQTPISQFVAYKAHEDTIGRDRRKREQRAGLSQDQRFSGFAPFHDWIEYVGDYTNPAVTIEITPKIGETTGSLFARLLVSSNLQAKMVFKGDLQDAFFYRNGEPIDPVIGGRSPQEAYEENRWVVMRDVAYRGYYVFGPEVLAPDSTGAPPSIVLRLDDLKHYDRFILFELPPTLVARAWNDFGPYYAVARPTVRFRQADPLRFKSDFSRLCSASALCSQMETLDRGHEHDPRK